ncbi:putative transcription factor bHLH family [Helianthus annuus]|nr:putative transcription factor bHLH family [Helianthus annuus]
MMVLMKMLRPLVENNAWDYCIVWKFGDDPSRCIEWMGCCCSGSQGVCRNVKEEIELLHVPYLCRDVYVKHSIRTSACEKLAMIPSSLSLFHGIHGEVAVSKQPMWLSNDSIGTQIVVPVEGGLIELYRSKHIPEDRRMIENLISRLGVIVDHGLHVDESKNCLSSYLYHHTGPTSELLFAVPQPTTHSLTQGEDKAFKKIKNKKVRGSKYKSKNLDAERNRRQRIKDGLYTLRALVPKISKMDHASIVGDAVDYIIDLQKNIKELQDELKELEEQDCEVNDDEVEVEVEVHEIGAREFLLKLMCSYKPGQFLRIMETVDSLGLEVIDINITTCNASVLNVLNLKAKDKDVAAKSLRDSLLTVCSIKAM